MEKNITIQTLQRLPLYLSLLKERMEDGAQTISSSAIAQELDLVEIQVRKDLASVSSNGGKPRVGYNIPELISDIQFALGYDNVYDAVIVGAGKLGKALLAYEGFKDYGLNIVAAFDVNEQLYGTDADSGKQILPLEKLPDLCRRMKIHIGIITVPAAAAQEASNLMVNSGIMTIWNFAPVHLRAPKNIMVKSENMAASLAVLSRHISGEIFEDLETDKNEKE